MTATLRRRGAIIAASLLVLALAAVLVSTSMSGARAQTGEVFTVWVIEDSVTASNGHGTIDFPLDPGERIVTASCSGNSPRGGPTIPGQVVTQVVNGVATVRILSVSGGPLNATVNVNCDIGVLSEAAPTTAQRKGAFAVNR
jgi:hypothetical protein